MRPGKASEILALDERGNRTCGQRFRSDLNSPVPDLEDRRENHNGSPVER